MKMTDFARVFQPIPLRLNYRLISTNRYLQRLFIHKKNNSCTPCVPMFQPRCSFSTALPRQLFISRELSRVFGCGNKLLSWPNTNDVVYVFSWRGQLWHINISFYFSSFIYTQAVFIIQNNSCTN